MNGSLVGWLIGSMNGSLVGSLNGSLVGSLNSLLLRSQNKMIAKFSILQPFDQDLKHNNSISKIFHTFIDPKKNFTNQDDKRIKKQQYSP